MKKIILIIMAASMLSACNWIKAKKPEGIVDQKEMIKILTDIQLAQAAISFERNKGRDYEAFQEPYYQYIFEKYGINGAILKENMDYYEQKPENLLKIYKRVQFKLDSLKNISQDTLTPDLNPNLEYQITP